MTDIDNIFEQFGGPIADAYRRIKEEQELRNNLCGPRLPAETMIRDLQEQVNKINDPDSPVNILRKQILNY